MLENVQQKTIQPIISRVVIKGSTFYTDEYNIYDRLTQWGYDHHTVNHSQSEYARDADGDGFHEIHVNTMEGFWSLLRSWLRPHRGISQEQMPLYLAFFEFTHKCQASRKSPSSCFTRFISSSLKPILSQDFYQFIRPFCWP